MRKESLTPRVNPAIIVFMRGMWVKRTRNINTGLPRVFREHLGSDARRRSGLVKSWRRGHMMQSVWSSQPGVLMLNIMWWPLSWTRPLCVCGLLSASSGDVISLLSVFFLLENLLEIRCLQDIPLFYKCFLPARDGWYDYICMCDSRPVLPGREFAMQFTPVLTTYQASLLWLIYLWE